MTVETLRQQPRWGHGLHPVAHMQWNQRRDDALELKAALESKVTPEWTEDLGVALGRMAKLFRDISRQSSRDWFVASSMMSHPSPRLAGRLASGLDKLSVQLDKDSIEGINKALENLEDAYLPRMLDHYLDVTRPVNPAPSKSLVGWAYMVSSPSDPSMVLAGATDGDIADVLASTSRANPGMSAFGIVAAWRVTDAQAAGRAIAEEMADNHQENGYYLSTSPKDLWDMKRRVDESLMASKIVVANPMHVPGAPKPIMSMRPFSYDISNKRFSSDVKGVFEAFRR